MKKRKPGGRTVWEVANRLKWLTGWCGYRWELDGGHLSRKSSESFLWMALMRGDKQSEMAIREWMFMNQ